MADTVVAELAEIQRAVLDRGRKPNVLVIIADDVGIDTMKTWQAYMIANAGFPSPTAVAYAQTPNLSALKTDGIRFMNARTQPNCSPTRANMLSGRYSFRHGVGSVINAGNLDLSLPIWEFGINHATDELIIQRAMSPHGYRSGIFGKWHLAGPDNGVVPNGVPWDGSPSEPPAAYGNGWAHPDLILGSANVDYGLTFSNIDRSPTPPDAGAVKPGYYNFYWKDSTNGLVSRIANQHHTAYSREQLEAWILAQDGPWIAHWAIQAIHSPFGNFPDNGAGFSGCMPPNNSTTTTAWSTYNGQLGTNPVYASVRAALEHMDHQIGLLKTNLGPIWDDDTVVIFMGDNGTQSNVVQDMQAFETAAGRPIGEPYASLLAASSTSFKGNPHEAGIRVPMFVRGPDWLVKDKDRDYWGFVDAVDIWSTIRHLSRISQSALIPDARGFDGISFVPALTSAANLDWTGSRQFAMSERFEPLGDPGNATDTELGHVKDRSYIKRIPGEDGVFKLTRIREGTGNIDTVYQLTEADYTTHVDPYMQSGTPGSSSDPIFVELALGLTGLLNSEGDIT